MSLSSTAANLWRAQRSIRHRVVERIGHNSKELPSLGEVDRQFTVHTDAAINVYEVGPRDAEVTVLFAHGFTLTAQSWAFQVRYLRKRHNVRMLIPDLRGHGHSTDGNELSVDATATDLLAILAQEVPRGDVVLVGHSLGVMTMLAVLRRMDASTRARVKGVALVNGAIRAFASAGVATVLTTPPVRFLRRLGKATPKRAERAKDGVEWLLKPVIAAFVYHGALEEGLSDHFDIVDFHAQQIDQTSMKTILGFYDDLVRHDETDAAPALAGIPGVVMVGRKDDVTPASQTRQIAEVWPDCTLREVPEAGHMLVVETPEAVNAELTRLLNSIGEQAGQQP
ncbi:alpha/beta fold hydrolase [Corynebacterium heidelbergense]|uniref:Alpha/beta hydrolase n=1 Tax=Corynebacterium heidelbergense TaxID=2055947 RepID=A0A364V5K0_9CORY|nr:alpha/beta hydrolase [Corynebacterium heidelbergense]RAV31914.1 alpha/beta hydrolase [Corynebacterium heidelbergense]